MVKLNHENKLVINAEYLERKLLNYVTSIVDGKSSPGLIIIINNNDSNLQLATLLKYGTNDRQRGPPDMILHMLVMSMMVT